MKVKTQIYSIISAEEALAVVAAGADNIGVLVGERNSPCSLRKEEALDIFNAVGAKANRILIPDTSDREEIVELCRYLKPDMVQICEKAVAGKEFSQRLKEVVPGVKIIQAIAMTGMEAKKEALRCAEFSDYLILDSVNPELVGIGAAGVTHDWSISADIVKCVPIPVILAGGLGPDNVAEAIKRVRPYGVDSLTKTSVVENGVIKCKDIEKVKAFCRNAKSVEL